VLWFDDVPRADLDIGPLLRELRRQPDPPPLLLLLSYREEHANALLDSIAHGGEEPGGLVERVTLGPLSTGETRALATLLCPADPERELRIAEVASESAGLPYLVGELARHVAGWLAGPG